MRESFLHTPSLVRSPPPKTKRADLSVNPVIVLLELRGIEPLTPRLPGKLEK
jgi:hypothetical protein